MIDDSYERVRIARLEEALRKANEEIGALGAQLMQERRVTADLCEQLREAKAAHRELRLFIDRNDAWLDLLEAQQ